MKTKVKHINTKFKKNKTIYNEVHVFLTGQYLVFPTLARTKKDAITDIKQRLHEMVEKL